MPQLEHELCRRAKNLLIDLGSVDFYLKFLFMVEGRKLYKPLLIRALCLNSTYCIYLCCSSKVKQKGREQVKPWPGIVATWLGPQPTAVSNLVLSQPQLLKQGPRLADKVWLNPCIQLPTLSQTWTLKDGSRSTPHTQHQLDETDNPYYFKA